MLTLKYKGTTTIPLEAECLTPDVLAGKTAAEIAMLPLQHGNAQAPLAEFFSVSGTAQDQELAIEGDCSRVKWIGAGMRAGRITIHGDAGMHLGAEMQGGEIQLHGNAGHLVGAAYRGSRVGTRGGVILIDANAGNEIGCNMRRGLIVIGGDAGDFAGVSLIAGSIFIFGQPGIRLGAGMKRGTIALFGERPQLLPTFRPDCVYRPVFITLYLRQLRAWGLPVPEEWLHGFYQRYSGDLVSLGKGEVLHWCRKSSNQA